MMRHDVGRHALAGEFIAIEPQQGSLVLLMGVELLNDGRFHTAMDPYGKNLQQADSMIFSGAGETALMHSPMLLRSSRYSSRYCSRTGPAKLQQSLTKMRTDDCAQRTQLH